MMLFLYILLNFINFFVYINLKYFNKFYLSFNKFNLIFKKKFKDTTRFEKFILVFFYKRNWFYNSIFNFLNSEEVERYKKDHHPLLNFFSYYNIISENNFINIFTYKKIYKFFKSKKYNKFSFKTFLLLQYIFNKRFFNFLNLYYYEEMDSKNILKLDFMFFYFNKKLRVKKKVYNLNYYNDWYIYNFNNKKKFVYKNKPSKIDNSDLKKLREKKFIYIKKIVKSYRKMYFPALNTKNFFSDLDFSINYFFKNNPFFFKKISFIKNTFSNFKKLFPVRFSETSVNKYINSYNINNYEFFFLRKNKIFNKSRYSRNRQLYRTGVYWCLWLNIMIVYGLYFIFYRFTFNFGYLWLGIFILAFSTIFSRILKYKFYNIFNLYNEFLNLFIWFGFILSNIFNFFFSFKKYVTKDAKISFLLFGSIKSGLINYIFYNFYRFLIRILVFLNKKKDYGFVFIWKNYGKKDTSFLRYKSIFHWFVQVYKVLTY